MQIGKKELDVRAFFTEAYEGQVPHDRSVQQLYTQYMTTSTETGVSYGLFNGVVKKLKDGTEPNSLVPGSTVIYSVYDNLNRDRGKLWSL